MLRAVFLAGALLAPAPLLAQGDFVSATAQAELRAVVAASPPGGAGIGLGVNVPAGYYARVGAVASATRDWGGSGGTRIVAGITGRLLLDPFAESAWGVYVGGGLGVEWRDGAHGRPAITVQLGLSMPGRGRWERAVELEAGGGLRAALVLRPRRARGR